MFQKRIILTALSVAFITACTSHNVITEEEIRNQNKADAAVSGALFNHDLDTQASYNIRKSGFVVIQFDESVSEKKYTGIVNLLRSNADINGLRAEQNGIEVCPVLR